MFGHRSLPSGIVMFILQILLFVDTTFSKKGENDNGNYQVRESIMVLYSYTHAYTCACTRTLTYAHTHMGFKTLTKGLH